MRELVLVQPGQSQSIMSRDSAAETVPRELERLLAENAPLAYRVALGVLRNPAEAEDVAQEALIRAYRRFDRLRDAQRFRSWLVRVTFRLALDRSRSARRREQRETLWARPELRPPDQSVEEIAASRQFQERLARALDELPDRLRLVILLTAIEGHSVDEVAALLDVPAGTVKSRLFAARKRLAEKLR
ncbi:MAG TPA: sigma-70 family RNA polymerase sigma factor [Candidatus Acidoferrum sp.]|jgi:RNA polymerase sigma-70 factor (ECF subfamily)